LAPPPPKPALPPSPAPLPGGDPAPGSESGATTGAGRSWATATPRQAPGGTTSGAKVQTPLYRVEFGADGAVRSWELAYRGAKPPMGPGLKAGDPAVTFGETPDHRQQLGRVLVGRPGREPEAFDAPGPALQEPREGPAPQLKDPHLIPQEAVSGGVTWVALDNDYFIAALTAGGGVGGLR